MSCPMTVRTLLEDWCDAVPDIVINGLGLDSRRIEPGEAFVAVGGAQAHGMAYAGRAAARGLSLIHI